MKLSKIVQFSDVNWRGVTELLVRRFQISSTDAEQIVRDFTSKFLLPFSLHWYRYPLMTPEHNRIAAALCELEGADEIRLEAERELYVPIIRIPWKVSVLFTPELKGLEFQGFRGKCEPVNSVQVGGWKLDIVSVGGARALFLFLMIAGVIGYVLSVGLVLYGISVLLLFIYLPDLVLRAVSNRWGMGFAFLCFLIGFAGLLGKAVRNIRSALLAKRSTN